MTWPRTLRVNAADAESGWWGDVWPVGGLYLSAVNTNPGTMFGFGTWEPYAQGLVLMGATNSAASPAPLIASDPSGPKVPTIPIYVWQRVS
jgi:hypothetical protein